VRLAPPTIAFPLAFLLAARSAKPRTAMKAYRSATLTKWDPPRFRVRSPSSVTPSSSSSPNYTLSPFSGGGSAATVSSTLTTRGAGAGAVGYTTGSTLAG